MARQDYELPAKFLDAADRFVALANEMGDRSHDGGGPDDGRARVTTRSAG
jgi:hypothetical protein